MLLQKRNSTCTLLQLTMMLLVSCSQLMGQLMCSSNTINTAKPEFNSIQKKEDYYTHLRQPTAQRRPQDRPQQRRHRAHTKQGAARLRAAHVCNHARAC